MRRVYVEGLKLGGGFKVSREILLPSYESSVAVEFLGEVRTEVRECRVVWVYISTVEQPVSSSMYEAFQISRRRTVVFRCAVEAKERCLHVEVLYAVHSPSDGPPGKAV
jgi:hypothetical protein